MVLEPRHKAYPQEAEEGEHVLPLRGIVRVLWRRLWLIVLVMVVLTGTAVGFSLVQTSTYEGSLKLLVGQRQEAGTPPANLGGNIEGLERLTKTLTEAVSSRLVAEAVVERLNLGIAPEDLLENLKVQQIPETQFIRVDYRDSDPRRAQLVANTVGEVVSELISDVSSDANAVTVTVWVPARVPNNPVSPNLQLNVLLALVLGAVLGLGLVFLLEYLGDNWRSPEETERVPEAPDFGVSPNFAPSGRALDDGKEGERR